MISPFIPAVHALIKDLKFTPTKTFFENGSIVFCCNNGYDAIKFAINEEIFMDKQTGKIVEIVRDSLDVLEY